MRKKIAQFLSFPNRKKMLFILLGGLLIRLLFAPFTLNWDLLANTRIIDSWGSLPLNEFYAQGIAAYPPLLYSLLKIPLNGMEFAFGPTFGQWLNLPDISLLLSPLTFRFLTVLKLPYILVELLAALVFSLSFSKKQQLLVLTLWVLNPVAIFIVSIWTSVDIVPLAAMIFSILLYKRGRFTTSALALGVGSAFKLFPIFVVPFLILSLPKLRQQIIGSVAAITPVILAHLPVLSVANYWNHAITGGYSKQILFAGLAIGHERMLLWYMLIYVAVLLFFQHHRQKSQLLQVFYWLPFALMFVFSKFNLQWLLWLVPFLIQVEIMCVQSALSRLLFYGSYFGLVIFSQASLNIGMLAPIEPTMWLLDWPLKEKIGAETVYGLLNIMHSAFAAVLLWLLYRAYQHMHNHAPT
ncbi:hypothetical protein C4579_00505 [Candidatus Microgenomates bacterium]|nr:MAG: hypothetical protein C4579_00505 [Candidatus Microgenomates bacterium]